MGPNKLRFFLAKLVSEDTDLSTISKKQIVRFLENASETQLKIFAMDNEIVAESNLDETARKIVDARFLNEAMTSTQKSAVAAGLGAASALAFGTPVAGALLSYPLIARMFGECAKKCGRIALTSKQRTCKEMCNAKRNAAIRKMKENKKNKK